jgi:hypothetical protein
MMDTDYTITMVMDGDGYHKNSPLIKLQSYVDIRVLFFRLHVA